MNKKLLTLFSISVIALLVLTACGGAVPATSAPAGPQAPAAQGGWCSGTDIVFFPGGAPGGSFETVVYNGALAAAADTGANVEYVWSDWNPEKMITQFSEAMATNPDGIAVMGHPGTAPNGYWDASYRRRLSRERTRTGSLR